MSRQLVWGVVLVVSALWAAAIWGGYELLGIMLGALPATSRWLNDFPLLQAGWEAAVQIMGGLDGVLQVLAWLLWGVGQCVLLVLAWLGLQYLPERFLAAIRARLIPPTGGRRDDY